MYVQSDTSYFVFVNRDYFIYKSIAALGELA